MGDRVYVTLDIDGSLCELDAATGRTLRTYERTKGTLEVIHDEGNLYVVVGEQPREQMPNKALDQDPRPGFVEVRSQRPGYREPQPPKAIVAIQVETGKQLWIKSDSSTRELIPTTLAANIINI